MTQSLLNFAAQCPPLVLLLPFAFDMAVVVALVVVVVPKSFAGVPELVEGCPDAGEN